MPFDRMSKNVFKYDAEKIEKVTENDEFYYQLIDTLIELYREWQEEITFGELRDKCMDKFFLDVNWTRTDWNQQLFRRLYLSRGRGHVYDERLDNEILYSPTDEGITFHMKRKFPLTFGEWAEGDKIRLEIENEMETTEDVKSDVIMHVEEFTPKIDSTPWWARSPEELKDLDVEEEREDAGDERKELRAEIEDLREELSEYAKLHDDLSRKLKDVKVEEKELEIPKQAVKTESIDLLSKLIVEDENKGSIDNRKIMIIDGSNVMRWRGSAKFSRFQLALKYCYEENYDKIYVICDANLKYKFDEDDKILFQQMLNGKMDRVKFQQSPAGTIADAFILTVANDMFKNGHKVRIMTNDLFRDFSNQEGENYNPDYERLLLKEKIRFSFMFMEGPGGNEKFYENPNDRR